MTSVGGPGDRNSGESNRSLTPNTFEKHRDTPLISIAILLQKYALPFAESSIYHVVNLHHDTPPICITMLLQKYSSQGSLEHLPKDKGVSNRGFSDLDFSGFSRFFSRIFPIVLLLFPENLFKVMFDLGGYFYLQGYFLEILQNFPLKQAQNGHF